MRVRVSGPQELIYLGVADSVRLRSAQGEIQILWGHAPYMAEIGTGGLEIREGGEVLAGKTSGGIVYNNKNEVSIILFEPYEFG